MCRSKKIFALIYYDYVSWELTNEIDQHVPLPAIIGWVGEKELDQTSVYRLLSLCRLHARMEEVVATLNLKKKQLLCL